MIKRDTGIGRVGLEVRRIWNRYWEELNTTDEGDDARRNSPKNREAESEFVKNRGDDEVEPTWKTCMVVWCTYCVNY